MQLQLSFGSESVCFWFFFFLWSSALGYSLDQEEELC